MEIFLHQTTRSPQGVHRDSCQIFEIEGIILFLHQTTGSPPGVLVDPGLLPNFIKEGVSLE
jgi:hypothetical protein